ncbi:phosphatase PAP2 family protein [Kibdelosporangium philippinense]|uniref:Phosphatase PAP2 family protein n=1 Tax=Kibdelosporangium philippinense TaxID=211113 RepID=A0ABS8ZDW8_9PSEU|nr:phosphatase PAP2 family protein [Kibdelosporangium philippinense]MCE7004871.1 phosphatase PAP2 family protein [Kibdelosporangium philippinense]
MPDSKEIAVLASVQDAIAKPAVIKVARGMSHFGEHSLGWLAIGAVGAAVDRERRKDWLVAAGAVFAAHAASVVVKRVVKRTRPDHETVQVHVGTPSKLSFPSAHATSTTAAAVVYGALTGKRLSPMLVPPMLLSRMVLGVHYPSDVVAGSVLGAAIGGIARRKLKGRKGRHGQHSGRSN